MYCGQQLLICSDGNTNSSYSLKMKNFLCVICIVFVISNSVCLIPENQNNTNMLPIQDSNTCQTLDGQFIEKDDVIPAPLGECYGIKCNSTLELEDELCGVATISKGCHGRAYDLSLPYPKCCPSEICKN